MRSGVLPAALLCAALGLILGFAPRRAWRCSLAMLVSSALVVACAAVPRTWQEPVLLGCWLSVMSTASMVVLPRVTGTPLIFALSINAGCWTGAVIASSGSPIDLVAALPCVLVAVPATWLVKTCRAPIVLQTIASWLAAVAVLAALLQVLPLTPGYLPDHLE